MDETKDKAGTGDADTSNTPPGKVPAQDPATPDASKRTPAQSLAEEVGLPMRPLAPETPSLSSGNLDMVRIIEDVKLPERKDFRAVGDTSPQQIREQAVQEESITPPAEEKKDPAPRDAMATVHTFKDDLQTVVHDKKISLVQAAALEADKRAHISRSSSEDGFRKPRAHVAGTLAIVGVLVFLGLIILGAVTLIIRDRSGMPGDSFIVEGLLFSEQNIPFPIQGYSATELKQLLIQTRSSSTLTLGAITRLTPVTERIDEQSEQSVESVATTREFLTAIGAHAPEELLRALSSEFFFGFHTVDENAPMLIIPVVSYERAFAGMLVWEASMNADLAPVFTGVPPLVRQADGLLVKREFADAVMRNYDVRTLKDDSDTVQLYYSFPTRELLIISESPYSFAEILARLRADRRL